MSGRRLTIAAEDPKGSVIATLASSTEVLRALAGTRARVLLVDRRAGRFHQAGEQLRLADRRPLAAARAAAASASTGPT